MKMTNLALVASVFAIAAAARGESYTFTPGTEIPLRSDYVATSNCSIQDDGYTVGSTHSGSSATISLSNQEAGDYVLSLKGGAKDLTASYTLTIVDAEGYEWTAAGEQANTGNWTAYEEVEFLVNNLPAGDFTLTLAITETSASYAGNYGYFKFSDVESCALAIPASVDFTSTAYAECVGCSVSETDGTINSVRNGSTFAVEFLCEEKGWYNLSFKSGAKEDWKSSSVAWTLRSASKGASAAETVATTSIGGDGYSFHGGAALNNTHTLDFGVLDAGLYVLTATVANEEGDYAANFGEFAFVARDYATIVSGEGLVLGESAKGTAKDYVALSNCLIDDPVQVIGSTHVDSSMTVSLYNETAGDWTLSWLGGANGLEAGYSVSVVGKSYSKSGDYTQANTSSWTPSQAESLVLAALPEGPIELVFKVTSTTGSYAGNYGHFRFVRKMPDIVVTTVTAWDDEWNDADSVTFSGDGALVVDASDYADWDSATKAFKLGNSNVSGLTSENILVVLGTAEATATAAYSDGSVTVTVAASTPAAETTWCGLGSDAAWSTAANWTHGLPSTTVAARFASNADVAMSSAQVCKIVLNGHRVSLAGSSCTVNVAAFESGDTGTIVLSGITLKGEGGTSETNLKCLEIPSGISIDVVGNSCLSDAYGTIWVCGKVTVQEGAKLELEYAVDLLGGIAGAGSIFVASNKGVGVRSADTKYGSRDPYTRYIDGDCSEFSGTFTEGGNSDRSVATYFRSITSGSASATWKLNGIKFGFSGTDKTSVFSLGNLVVSTPGTASGDDIKKIDVVTSGTAFTLEIGGANGDSSLVTGYTINSTDIAFKKVGTGTLTLDGCTLAALTVSEGAIAAGASAPTVGMLAMAAGSYVVANTTATINATTAAIDGVKVLVADATALAAGEKYDLVSATALSGTPEVYAVDSEGNHVPAANAKPKNVWIAKARANALRLSEGNPNAGMTVVIR